MEKKRNQVKRNSPTKTAAIGALLTIIGGFFLSYNYIQAKKVMAYDFMANAFYNGEEIVNIQEEEETKEAIKEEELPEEVTDEYIGYLTIPKINLTKGFLDKRSTENDVEKNILVVEGSNYPDTEKGNLILAGHSGTGWKAFFNDLYQLEVNDTVYVTYTPESGEDKILEDDIITIWGTAEGDCSYTSTMGATITLPLINAECIEIN